MKTRHLLFLIVWITAFHVTHAQSPKLRLAVAENGTYNQAIAQSMQNLPADRIPYDVLYDNVFGWSFLSVWNNNDTTNLSRVKQSWIDLQNSHIAPVPDTYSNLTYILAGAENSDKIPLVSIVYRFGVIDTLAFRDGRMRIENNQLVDAGLASPYLTKQVGMAALGTESVVANKTYTLMESAASILNNVADNAVTRITVQNLTSGATSTLNGYGTVSTPVSFTVAGTNTLKIQTVMANNTVYTNYQQIQVLPLAESGTRSTGPNDVEPSHHLLTSTIPFQGTGESHGTISYADYHIYYHFISATNTSQSERVLRKPIIILDGFDSGDKRSYDNLYKNRLAYKVGNDSIKLGDEMRKKGYDVIILNFPRTGLKVDDSDNKTKLSEDIPNTNCFSLPLYGTLCFNRDGGTDFIQRNAYLLVKLIQETNAKLTQNGSSEKLVIVGPSMGGLISRYALAYMEKNGMNHNTRLWVSLSRPKKSGHLLAVIIPVNFMFLSLLNYFSFVEFVNISLSRKNNLSKTFYKNTTRRMRVEIFVKTLWAWS